MSFLVAEGITKKFSGVVALDNVNFDVKLGEIHSVLGQNGAGKSTLLKVLYGYHKPDGGRLIINGREVRFKGPADARRHGIVLINQEITLMSHLTVYENIALIGFMWNKSFSSFKRKKIMNNIKNLIDKYGLYVDLSAKIRDLSVANKMKVQILAALSISAKVLLFDEPTSPMPPRETEQVLEILTTLKGHGFGVVFVTHRINEALKISDRITVLRDGKLMGTVNAKEVSDVDLAKMMLGSELKLSISVSERAMTGKLPVIEIIDLKTRPLKATEVPLMGVNLKVYEGEVVSIFGLLGSGKTELGKALIGLEKIESGKIIYYGKEIIVKSPAEALSKYGIIYLTEDRKSEGLIPHFNVAQNISISSLSNISRIKLIINKIFEYNLSQDLIKKLNIKATPYVKVTALSGGNQQKTLIARALASKAKLVIVDEPTVGVDIGSRVEIRRKIREAARENNIAVLILTGDIDDAIYTSDRVYIIYKGKIVKEIFNNFSNIDKIRQEIIEELVKLEQYERFK